MNRGSTVRAGATTKQAKYGITASASSFNENLERATEASKNSLTLAVEHNAEVLASYKKTLNASFSPYLLLFDLAGKAFEGYATLQKGLAHLGVEQSTTAMKIAARYNPAICKTRAEIEKPAPQPADQTQNAIASAAENGEAVSDALKQQASISAPAIQNAIDSVPRDSANLSEKQIVEAFQFQFEAMLAKEIVDKALLSDLPAGMDSDIVQFRVDASDGIDPKSTDIN
jgi:hypothetical protein